MDDQKTFYSEDIMQKNQLLLELSTKGQFDSNLVNDIQKSSSKIRDLNINLEKESNELGRIDSIMLELNDLKQDITLKITSNEDILKNNEVNNCDNYK